jgi:hypothetical protein
MKQGSAPESVSLKTAGMKLSLVPVITAAMMSLEKRKISEVNGPFVLTSADTKTYQRGNVVTKIQHGKVAKVL